MSAVVVYESLWGNTAAIARAIAEGLGPGTTVGSTAEVSQDVAANASLLVVGAPVHAMGLPTASSLASVANRRTWQAGLPADLDHPLMRDWIAALPEAEGPAATFDTRIGGLLGRGGASTLERLLKARGRRIVQRGEGFVIVNQREVHTTASMLREGELARAAEWGARLASLVS